MTDAQGNLDAAIYPGKGGFHLTWLGREARPDRFRPRRASSLYRASGLLGDVDECASNRRAISRGIAM
ncbi:hypothetical protein ACRAWF_10555 [Streptomyces sp. L7]